METRRVAKSRGEPVRMTFDKDERLIDWAYPTAELVDRRFRTLAELAHEARKVFGAGANTQKQVGLVNAGKP